MDTETKVYLCNQDFYKMLTKACEQAGGGDPNKMRAMYFDDFVQLVARNGMRVVYMPDKHMDALQITWKAPTPVEVVGHRQLLTDAYNGVIDKE